MLDIGVNLNIDVKRPKYPIHFERVNCCVHCGSDGTLTFVDKFGRETSSEIYPFDHIKCKKCGRSYSIMWQKDEETGKMYPSACDPSIKHEFFNLVDYFKIKKHGEKEFK